MRRWTIWSGLPAKGFLPFKARASITNNVSNSGTAKIKNGAKKPKLVCWLYPVPIHKAASKKPSSILPLSPKKVFKRLAWLYGQKPIHAPKSARAAKLT